MADVLTFPTRPAASLVRTPQALDAARLAFPQSPRGRFEEHVNRLISLGHIGVGHAVLINYRDFAANGSTPEPGAVGEIHRLLLMVDQTDALAVRHARLAATALLAISFPFSEPTQPECA